MAGLDGFDIFGECVHMNRTNMPRESQQASAPGVNGVESTDLGMRGRVTHVRGRLFGTSPGNLDAVCQGIESYMDGRTHVFVDNKGWTWLNVMLESFAPDEDSYRLDFVYGYTCTYKMTLRHLT